MLAKDRWRQSIYPRIEVAREFLKGICVDDLIRTSGATRCEDRLELSLFATSLLVSLPEFVIRKVDGSIFPEETQSLILDYFVRANGAAVPESELSAGNASPSSCWIGFQELPDGAFYANAFRSYTSAVLVNRLNGDTYAFRQASARFGGESIALGDAAYAFRALPNISLAVVWWAGDDEFPANAGVLFDASAGRYLPTDGLAALGKFLCRGLLNIAMPKKGKESYNSTRQ